MIRSCLFDLVTVSEKKVYRKYPHNKRSLEKSPAISGIIFLKFFLFQYKFILRTKSELKS